MSGITTSAVAVVVALLLVAALLTPSLLPTPLAASLSRSLVVVRVRVVRCDISVLLLPRASCRRGAGVFIFQSFAASADACVVSLVFGKLFHPG
jgi:hypothetical protein